MNPMRKKTNNKRAIPAKRKDKIIKICRTVVSWGFRILSFISRVFTIFLNVVSYTFLEDSKLLRLLDHGGRNEKTIGTTFNDGTPCFC